ncbi:MAG: MurT ligase domain-containing protein [Elainellaceae cyanobacterium]
MNKLLLIPILVLAKSLIAILKASKRGSGTALPGYLVGKYFPFTFKLLIRQIPNIITITGTNGKTTSQTMLDAVLSQQEGVKILRNSAGANLSQGILSELIKQTDLLGNLHFTHAILEVEEATLPRIATLLRPTVIAVTNLYRDQLDAYGETDMTEKLIRDGIAQCPTARVVVNGDDPRTSRLTQGLPNPTHYVSLPEAYAKTLPYEGDFRGSQHLHENVLRAEDIHINADLTTDLVATGDLDGKAIQPIHFNIKSPGFFHVYNALTTLTIAKLLNVSDDQIRQGFQQFTPAFGRGEVLVREQAGKRVSYRVLLVKNPASFSLSLDLIKTVPQLKVIFAINDNTADSKDVSWLWDSQLEYLNQATIDWVICTGIRAKDMQVRLKYAFDDRTSSDRTQVNESIKQAIAQAFDRAQDGDTIYVLPTYTAMLEFRKHMGKMLE